MSQGTTNRRAVKRRRTGTPAELDFDAPTPRPLRAKMVKKSDIMRRLRQEFRGVRIKALDEHPGLGLLDFNAENVIVHAQHGIAVAADVLFRAYHLEKLAYYRNADIKFGVRSGKGRWWQSATSH